MRGNLFTATEIAPASMGPGLNVAAIDSAGDVSGEEKKGRG